MDGHSLIPLESINAVEIFTGKKLDDLLLAIRKETATILPDVLTAGGRKEIASLAYKVARSKTTIDDAGKTLVADWKKRSAEVDASRKRARDYLDALRDEVRKPLDDWEAEQARIEREAAEKAEAERKAIEEAKLAEIAAREAELRSREEAIAAKEREEAARVAKERAEAERKARDEQIRKDAEECAKREAQEAIERVALEAKEAKEAARFAGEKAEADRLAAIERERLATERAEREKQEAIRQAEVRARREAEQREKDRSAEEARIRAEEERKARNRAHRAKINNDVMQGFVKAKVDEEAAKALVIAIAGGHIPHVTINY